DADTRVVPPLGHDLPFVAEAVDRLAGCEDGRGRLHGEAANDRLPGRDAAEDAASVVRQELWPAVGADAYLVCILLARELGRRHSGADLDPLHGIDAHEGRGEVLVELSVDRRAEPGRHPLG